MKSNLRWTFFLLCAVPFVMVLSNSMLIPVLPQLKSSMDISLFQAGLIFTAFSIPAGIVIPLGGFLSDRFGRKTVMVPALFLYGLGGTLGGIAPLLAGQPYPWILAGRILQGIGGGGTYQLAMTMTGDLFEGQKRTKSLGILEASNGLGKVSAPIIGAAAALLFWFAPFFVYGLFSFPVAIAIWISVRETQKKKDSKPFSSYIESLKKIFQKKGVSLGSSYFAGMVVLFTLFGVLSYFSDILESRYEIRGITRGLIIAVPVLAMAVTSYLSGTYMQKALEKVAKWVIVGGMGLISATLVAMALSGNTYVFFAALFFLGIGTGAVLPSLGTLITSAAEQEERGLVTCLYGTVRFFGAALGPPAFGLTVQYGRLPMFLGGAGIAALALVLALFLINERVLLNPGA